MERVTEWMKANPPLRYFAGVSYTEGKQRYQAAMDAEFNEADHPRTDNGQFGTGGGGKPKAEKKRPGQRADEKRWKEEAERHQRGYEAFMSKAPPLPKDDTITIPKVPGAMKVGEIRHYRDEYERPETWEVLSEKHVIRPGENAYHPQGKTEYQIKRTFGRHYGTPSNK